jgi:hypothetical protein
VLEIKSVFVFYLFCSYLCKINEQFKITICLKLLKMVIAEKMPIRENALLKKTTPTIPDALIWEILDGQPLYRRGYKDVLRKLKTIEDIMGTSSYQALISDYITKLLHRQLDDEQSDVLASEIGAHLTHKNNFSIDIAIYPLLSADKITKKYTNYPAKIAIEVDIDIDPSVMKDMEYVNKKTKRLLNFGVEKVIWILTNIKQVIVATPNSAWLIVDWTEDIEILDGISFNIQAFLDKRGINPDMV